MKKKYFCDFNKKNRYSCIKLYAGFSVKINMQSFNDNIVVVCNFSKRFDNNEVHSLRIVLMMHIDGKFYHFTLIYLFVHF